MIKKTVTVEQNEASTIAEWQCKVSVAYTLFGIRIYTKEATQLNGVNYRNISSILTDLL